MCICMIFTLLPFSVLADNEGNENGGTDTGESACAQKGDIVYGSYDTNGDNWTADSQLTAANAVKQYPAQGETSATGANITYSKTAAKAEGDNTYDITLNVTATTNKTAVVLVLDASKDAHECCVECGWSNTADNNQYDTNGNLLKGHTKGCAYYKDTNDHNVTADQTFLASEKRAALEFINNYAGSVVGAGRYVRIVSYQGTAAAHGTWVDVSTPEGKAAAVAALDTVAYNADAEHAENKNLEQGLSEAFSCITSDGSAIANITAANIYTIVMTNSRPDAYGENCITDGGPTSDAVSSYTKDTANKLKEKCTVCTVYNRNNVEPRLDGNGFDTFLKEIATSADWAENRLMQGQDGHDTWQKNVVATTFLSKIKFGGVTSGFTVTDPMGKYMELLDSSLTDCEINEATANSPKTIVWTPTTGIGTDNNNGSVSITYTLKYTVTVNTALSGFEYDKYYPTNGETTLSFTDGQVYERRPNYEAGPYTNPETGEIIYRDGKPLYPMLPYDWYDNIVTLQFNVPGVMVKYIPKDWNIDVSKTATELKKDANGDYKTNVTLSVPGVEESLDSDVVFVLDGSSSAETDVVIQSLALLNDLKQAAADNGAAVNVCVVKFKRQAFKSAWFDLATQLDAIKEAMGTKYSGGSNIHAGLLAGKEALDEHDNVAANRKYLVLISDGSTYLYSKDGNWASDKPFTRSYYTKDNYKGFAGGFNDQGLYEPNNYPDVNVPRPTTTSEVAAWQAYFADVKARNATVNTQGKTGDDYDYLSNYNAETGNWDMPDDFKSQPCEKRTANNRDMAYYYADQTWQQIKAAGYNAYSIAVADGSAGAGNSDDSHCFMNYLNEGKSLNFSDIKNDILFVVGAGSTIEDTIGKDFTLDTESFKLTVGKTEYVAAKADSEEGTIKYDFTKPGAAASTFSLVYTESSRSFTLNIGEDVTYAAPVQLSYTLKLTTPETKPGTYGQLDLNGDGKIDSTEVDVDTDKAIYTNNKATLTPVDSDGHEGVKKDFPKPSVEYTVKNPYRPPVNPGIGDEIIVEITGNSDSVVYDGTEHNVKGYTVEISDSRYTEKDFIFSGKDIASGVNAGSYEMGLKADQFKNTNALFKNVKFVIKADGVLTITPMDLTITAGSKDGIAPVTCNEYESTDLAKGDVIESVKITGEQLEPGQSPNVASDAVIKNAKGEDVTKNYNIKYVDGTLKAVEPLNKEDHFNYIVGYTDGTIRPNNNITRAEVAAIFFRLLTDEARSTFMTDDCSFSDVAQGAWCRRSIATLTNAEIISGYTDGTFKPNAPITRAELATIIARFAKLDVNTKTFSDINGHWAQKYIELAAGNGWIDGYTDGTFRPNQNIKRAETFAMINRVLDRVTESNSDLLPTDQMNMWSDNMDFDAWYYRDVQEATNNHKAERVGDSIYEKWTEKLPDIDWAAIQL